MAIVNGPYIPLNGLVLMADPRNTKCYSGAGTTAYNQVDNTAMTLSSIGYSGGYWTNAAAGAVTSNTAYNLSLTAGYTVVQWLKLTTTAGGFFNYVSGSKAINFYAGGSTKMRWETYLSGGDLNSNTSIPTGIWAMWAGSFSGVGSDGAAGTSKIYYNGNLDNSGTLAGTSSNAATFQLGVYSGPCNGSIGPTMFWNRALTDIEVRNVFQASRRSFGL